MALKMDIYPYLVLFLSSFFERGKDIQERKLLIYTFLKLSVPLCPALAIGLSLLLLGPSHSEEGKYTVTAQITQQPEAFLLCPFHLLSCVSINWG